MNPSEPIPSSVLVDKDRLADFILARSVEKGEEKATGSPAPAPPAALVSRTPQGIFLNLARLKSWVMRPTAWSISAAVHLLLLLALAHWAGFIKFPEPTVCHLISFGGSEGEGGDGHEAGGSGSAPAQGPDLAGQPIPQESPAAPPPAPAVKIVESAPAPASSQGSAAVVIAGGGAGASGGTVGEGHGGSGGGLFGARKGHGHGLGLGGGTPASEASVALGLAWLAAHQDGNGAWNVDAYAKHCPNGDACGVVPPQPQLASYNPGITGLALLAFLGAGHTHLEGEHRNVAAKAAAYLEGIQQGDGAFGRPFNGMMYGQGIATLALAELYAMTRDERAGSAAQRGVDFIERAQQSAGGWDYVPEKTGRNDTSVTGWQVMALKSAQAAGLKVAPEAFLRAMGHFIRLAQPDGGTQYANQDPAAGRTGNAMAGVGLASRVFMGWSRNAPAVQQAVAYCLKDPPDWAACQSNEFQGPYYWYYATMGIYQVGGEAWERWNAAARDMLVAHQERRGHAAGSWDPQDRYGAVGGRLTNTALNLLTLEVYYRYLPVYDQPGGTSAFFERMVDALPSQGRSTALAMVVKEFDRESAVTLLHRLLDGAVHPDLRLEAASKLMELGDDAGAGLMADAADHLSASQAVRLASSLLKSGHPNALPLLAKAMKDSNPVVRFGAVKVLQGAGQEGVPLLQAALEDADEAVRVQARQALGRGAKALATLPAPVPAAPPGETWKAMHLGEILLALDPPTPLDASEHAAARAAWEALVQGAREAVGKGADPVRAVELLNRYLYELKGFSSCPTGSAPEGIYLADTLKTHRANCVGLSGLYLALCEELEIPVKVVSLPKHCLLRLEAPGVARNIETTDGGKDVPDGEYPRLLEDDTLKPAAFRSAGREAYLAAFLSSRGAALGRRREYDKSLADLNLALALDADNLTALSNRGNCLRELGRREEAKRDFTKALALSPAWLPALMGQAAWLEEAGRTDEAGALLAKAVETHPDSIPAVTQLGENCRRRGDLARALALADKALALDGNASQAHCLKGVVLYQKGDAAAAEQALGRAVSLAPGDGAIRAQLGRFYCGVRRWSEATQQLQAALACDPPSMEARTLLDYVKENGPKP